jgi:hypothetical protein
MTFALPMPICRAVPSRRLITITATWPTRQKKCRPDGKLRRNPLLERFGRVLALWLDCGLKRRCWYSRAANLGDGCKDYPPISEEDADVLEVLIGQMRERSSADPIFGKLLRVLPETELFEPVRYLLHCRPVAGSLSGLRRNRCVVTGAVTASLFGREVVLHRHELIALERNPSFVPIT